MRELKGHAHWSVGRAVGRSDVRAADARAKGEYDGAVDRLRAENRSVLRARARSGLLTRSAPLQADPTSTVRRAALCAARRRASTIAATGRAAAAARDAAKRALKVWRGGGGGGGGGVCSLVCAENEPGVCVCVCRRR